MVAASESSLGLIAGDGRLPFEVARAARRAGRPICAIGYPGITDPDLEGEVDTIDWIHLGQLETLLETFSRTHVCEAVLAGKVSKQHLYGDISALRPDARALDVISRVDDLRDDSVLEAIATVLGEQGVVLLPQIHFCRDLVAPPGVLGCARPSRAQWADIEFGWPIAKAIGGLDIGQSLVVESRAVLAVEAIEGTDAAVERGGRLGSGAASLIKVAKPTQDPRFDLPTVGPGTLRSMLDAGVAVLAFEAHCTIILDREELVRSADANGVALVALDAAGPGTP